MQGRVTVKFILAGMIATGMCLRMPLEPSPATNTQGSSSSEHLSQEVIAGMGDIMSQCTPRDAMEENESEVVTRPMREPLIIK